LLNAIISARWLKKCGHLLLACPSSCSSALPGREPAWPWSHRRHSGRGLLNTSELWN
jgi:hypothetical protein